MMSKWIISTFHICVIDNLENGSKFNVVICTLFIYFEELVVHIWACVGEPKVGVNNIVKREYIFTIWKVPLIIIATV